MAVQPSVPTFAELFTPKLVTILSERYGLADLRADMLAALTVAVVALPLSMAIAIASGVSPDRGLYSSIVGGFLVSLLGGSRFQIGGPAGAFVVLVLTAVQRLGAEDFALAVLVSGAILIAVGFLRLGTYIKFIPYPVTVGFTAGIALVIFASQLAPLLGLRLDHPEPGPLLPKLAALFAALPSVNPAALALSALSICTVLAIRRFRPHWPTMLIAVTLAAAATWALGLPVETIGSRYGGIPGSLPTPHLPMLSLERIAAVLPDACAFALLGGIESLLSAVVADGMTGRRHRSNCELVAQGVANIGSALFGGICVTGAIARTATNIRAGARGPIAGILHAVFLLIFLLVAAPLARFIPLAALAGVLAIVAWNMVEKHAIATLLRVSRGDALVLLATFFITVFRDLTDGILVGFSLGTLLFLGRMAQSVEIQTGLPLVEADRADRSGNGGNPPYDALEATDPNIIVHRISGAFFFGAAAAIGTVLDRLAEHPKAYILDFSAVPMLDSTGAATIESFVHKATRQHAAVCIVGARSSVRHMLIAHGVRAPEVRYEAALADALAVARAVRPAPTDE